MSNIATVLKEKISRISRRGLRSETGGLKKASPQTIYNWESGRMRPRPQQITVIECVSAAGAPYAFRD